MTKAQRCKAITRRGTRCEITVSLSREGFCLWHDPKRTEQARTARVRGGHEAKKVRKARRLNPDTIPAEPQTLDDIIAWSAWIARCVALGSLHPKKAQAMSRSLANMRTALERRDLAKEVEQLRAEIRTLRRGKS